MSGSGLPVSQGDAVDDVLQSGFVKIKVNQVFRSYVQMKKISERYVDGDVQRVTGREVTPTRRR